MWSWDGNTHPAETQEEVFRAHWKAICCQGTAADPMRPTDTSVDHSSAANCVTSGKLQSLWASLFLCVLSKGLGNSLGSP